MCAHISGLQAQHDGVQRAGRAPGLRDERAQLGGRAPERRLAGARPPAQRARRAQQLQHRRAAVLGQRARFGARQVPRAQLQQHVLRACMRLLTRLLTPLCLHSLVVP